MIYQLFNGRYIDLSKLVSVSEISADDWWITFYLTMQLVETPIEIKITKHGALVRANGSISQQSIEDIHAERENIIYDWQEFIKAK